MGVKALPYVIVRSCFTYALITEILVPMVPGSVKPVSHQVFIDRERWYSITTCGAVINRLGAPFLTCS